MVKFQKLVFLTICLLLLPATKLIAQEVYDFKFYHENDGNYKVLLADNNEFMPMSVKLTYEATNINPSKPSGEIIVVPPGEKRYEIFRFQSFKPNEKSAFRYNLRSNFGDATQTYYDNTVIYDLPFQSGKTHKIFQGYQGKRSHKGQNALDFDLKIGDPIHAAREGIVVRVVDEFDWNCPDISCVKYNNYILIMHKDFTFAEYTHLKKNGALVKKGETVEKGQLIGQSGNTGYSSGPHLHFSVFLNPLTGQRKSIKTPFKTSKGKEYLQEGKTYFKDY